MRLAAVFVVGLFVPTLSACREERDSCDSLTAAMADRREECGAPRGDDEWGGGCDPQYVMEETCRLGCWQGASCETIRGEDQAGGMRLQACIRNCGP